METFNRIKQTTLSNNILIHYDPEWKLIVASNAIPIGIGTVLSHLLPDGSEKPIALAFASRSNSEKKYAQIDEEALALVFQ